MKNIFPLLLLFLACQPAPVLDIYSDASYHPDCATLPDYLFIQWGAIQADTFYSNPQFHPVHGREILFRKSYHAKVTNGSGTFGEIRHEWWRYDLGSDQLFPLPITAQLKRLEWGPDNWLLFDTWNGQIWKIKVNGDSLTLVNSADQFSNPSWSPDGQWISCFRGYRQEKSSLTLLAADGRTNVDTFDARIPAHLTRWSPDGERIAASTATVLYLYDLPSLTWSRLIDEPANGIGGLEWLPNQSGLIYLSQDGLTHVDLSTGETRIIRRNCDTYRYEGLEIHPDGEFLMVSRRHTFAVAGDFFAKTDLVRIGIDGSFEQVLYPRRR